MWPAAPPRPNVISDPKSGPRKAVNAVKDDTWGFAGTICQSAGRQCGVCVRTQGDTDARKTRTHCHPPDRQCESRPCHPSTCQRQSSSVLLVSAHLGTSGGRTRHQNVKTSPKRCQHGCKRVGLNTQHTQTVARNTSTRGSGNARKGRAQVWTPGGSRFRLPIAHPRHQA